MDNQDDDGLEKLMGKLGDFGRYQRLQFMLHVIAAVPTALHILSLVTVAAVPDHRCAVEGDDNSNYTNDWNSSSISNALPVNEYGKLDSCHVYGNNNTLVECQSWVYDTQYYTSSRGIEWNFVCSRRWMGAVAQTTFMLGLVVGSCVLGPLCDKYGRRTIFVWSGLLQLFVGTAVAFTTEYFTFLAFRFVYGIVAVSPFKAGYVLTIELVGRKKSTMCGALFQIMFAVGVMLVGVWGYIIDNRFYLQIVYGLHAVVLIPHWVLMDESPRWLWAQGRFEESVAIVEKALKYNRSIEKIDSPLLLAPKKTKTQKTDSRTTSSVYDLFRTPNMRRKSLITFGCWYAVSAVYYGLALNTGKLYGNPYLMVFIGGFVEVPGYVTAMYFVSRVGHRAVLSTTMLWSGMTLLVVVALHRESTSATIFAMFGKMIISGAFAVTYKYSAELFPTVIRSSGVGLGTMCTSLSASLTPLIYLLDSFNPKVPIIVFGLLAIIFGSFTMFLPETLGHKLPQTLEDGENFGKCDTCFSDCFKRRISIDTGSLEAK